MRRPRRVEVIVSTAGMTTSVHHEGIAEAREWNSESCRVKDGDRYSTTAFLWHNSRTEKLARA